MAKVPIKQQMCLTCDGSGSVLNFALNDAIGVQSCPVCRGAGYTLVSQLRNRGLAWPPEPWTKAATVCLDCEGTGHRPWFFGLLERTCKTCNGKGAVYVPLSELRPDLYK